MKFHFPARKYTLSGAAALHGLLAIAPLTQTYWLYRLAQRAASLTGYWPVPMINDPKWIGPHDLRYQHLFDVCLRIERPVFFSFFAWIIAAALFWRWYCMSTRCWLLGLFVFSWGILWLNPWQLLPWWLD